MNEAFKKSYFDRMNFTSLLNELHKLDPYEARMHPLIKSMPLIAVCAYPINDCSMRDVRRVIESHDNRMIPHR